MLLHSQTGTTGGSEEWQWHISEWFDRQYDKLFKADVPESEWERFVNEMNLKVKREDPESFPEMGSFTCWRQMVRLTAG